MPFLKWFVCNCAVFEFQLNDVCNCVASANIWYIHILFVSVSQWNGVPPKESWSLKHARGLLPSNGNGTFYIFSSRLIIKEWQTPLLDHTRYPVIRHRAAKETFEESKLLWHDYENDCVFEILFQRILDVTNVFLLLTIESRRQYMCVITIIVL